MKQSSLGCYQHQRFTAAQASFDSRAEFLAAAHFSVVNETAITMPLQRNY
jgi:hypothetical protein